MLFNTIFYRVNFMQNICMDARQIGGSGHYLIESYIFPVETDCGDQMGRVYDPIQFKMTELLTIGLIITIWVLDQLY